MHLLDLLGGVALFGEEGLHGRGDRVDEGGQVAEVDVLGRARAVRRVLLRAVVAQPYLVLVVEPGLAVLGRRGVEDPASEARSGLGQVLGLRQPVLRLAK